MRRAAESSLPRRAVGARRQTAPTVADLWQLSRDAYGNHNFAAGGAEVLVSRRAGYLMAAWRGTTFDGALILADMLANLRALPWRDGATGAWCHRGFLGGARAVWSQLHKRLAREPDVPVWFCGHSKGGAEATISAAIAWAAGIRVAGVVTFGAPRPGLQSLADRLDRRVPVLRVVAGSDIVPTVPWVLGRYRHPGVAVQLGCRHGGDGLADHRIAFYGDLLGAHRDLLPDLAAW